MKLKEHWSKGLSDMQETLRHRERLDKPGEDEPFVTHDLHRSRPADEVLAQISQA